MQQPPNLRARVRWVNVARVGALVLLAVLVGAWPRLRDGGPELPPTAAEPVIAQQPAPPRPTEAPTSRPEQGSDRDRRAHARAERLALGRQAAQQRAARRRAARRRALGRQATRPTRRPTVVAPPPAPAAGPRPSPPAGSSGEFGF